MTPEEAEALLRPDPLPDLDALRREGEAALAALMRDVEEGPARIAALLDTIQREEGEALRAILAELEAKR